MECRCCPQTPAFDQQPSPAMTDPTYLCHRILNGTLIGHIALVADEKLVHTLRGVAVDFLEPLLDVVEGVHVCDIIHDADAMGAAVV